MSRDRSTGVPPGDADGRPSRSERKREHQAVQRLAAAALAAPAARLNGLALDDEILEALRGGRAMKASAARERHMRHLANLLAADPAAAAAITAVLDRDPQAHAAEAARLHALERWRDRLLAEGDVALEDLLAAHPGADATALRTLVRQAAREVGTPRQAAAARRLFQALKSACATAPDHA